MVLTLISATPSPFARMNRIALMEKGIPFELKNEIPWHEGETETPQYNPLEKLPILLDPADSSFEPVYDSSHIQEYIVAKFSDKSPRLVTGDVNLDLKARQILVLAQGVLDAFVGEFWELRREHRSQKWMDRQGRKIDGGMKAMDDLVKNRKGKFLVGDGNEMTIADIAVICAAGQIDFSGHRPDWQEKLPDLAEWLKGMDEREAVRDTKPFMFDLNDGVV